MPLPTAAPHRARIVALACLAMLCAGLLASCAGVRPGSRPPPPAAAPIISAPAPTPQVTTPAPPPAVTAPFVFAPPAASPRMEEPEVAPAAAAPSSAPSMPGAVAKTPVPVPEGPPIIALILPLEVPAFARAADAVRAGFMAAADAAGASARTRVFTHGEDGVLPAFEAAQAAGASVIVGPLTRDDLRVVVAMTLELPFTIALNQLDDGATAPPKLYTFALSIDSDARLIARRLRVAAPGALPNVVVIGAETALMKRFAGAFASEWMAIGGGVPGVYRFDGTPEAMTAMRRDIARKPPDAALLALDGGHAALAKPYLGTVASYASGLVFERESQAVVRDLDGLMLTEIPWIIDPGAPQFAALPKREFGSSALTRLYALGLDAFRVAQSFRDGAPERFTLDGATGLVTLVDSRQFAREGRFAVFRAGQLTPLDGPR